MFSGPAFPAYSCLFWYLYSIVSATYTADILFLLDDSGSTSSQFPRMLEIVGKISENLIIGPNDVQVSVVTFGHVGRERFSLTAYTDQSLLLSAINAISPSNGSELVYRGLQFAINNTFQTSNGDRPTADNYVIMITDVSPYDATTINVANALQAVSTVIMIGFGSRVTQAGMEKIASSPSDVFLENTLTDVTGISNRIGQSINAPSFITTHSTTSTTASTTRTTTSTTTSTTTTTGTAGTPLVEATDSTGLSSAYIAFVAVGCLVLFTIVLVATVITFRSIRNSLKRRIIRNCELRSPLDYTRWDYLVVVDNKDPIKDFTENLIDALKGLKLLVKRVDVPTLRFHLHANNLTIEAKNIAFYVCNENTSMQDCRQLCINLGLLKEQYKSVLINDVNRECLTGRSFIFDAQANNMDPVCIATISTKEELLYSFIKQYFDMDLQTKAKSFNSIEDNKSMLSLHFLGQIIHNYLTAFSFVSCLHSSTDSCNIILTDVSGDIGSMVIPGTRKGRKYYAFFNQHSKHIVAIKQSIKNNTVVFGRNEIIKGVVTILLDFKLIKKKTTWFN